MERRALAVALSRHAATYPVLFDKGGVVQRAWGAPALPETFVVARDGRVVRHVAGPLDEAELAGLIETAESS